MKSLLVTGGAGFISSNLIRRLFAENYKITTVDDMSAGDLSLLSDVPTREANTLRGPFLSNRSHDDRVDLIIEDFSSQRILKMVEADQFDVIFHLAATPRVAYSVENPVETNDNNVTKTLKLMTAARGHCKRFVFSSSSSVYGGESTLPTVESSLKSPKSPYALQKSIIEEYGKLYSSLYGLDFVSLRYFNVFGPGQNAGSPYSTAVSAWCHAVKNNLTLRSDGDGTQSRDLCYVDNVVSANLLAAQSSKKFSGEVYNVCCGDRTSNNEILDVFMKRFPGIKIESAPWRPGDVMHTQGDWSSANRDLGYSPEVRISEGLERTFKWWKI